MRAPIKVYDAGLGLVFGERFLMLEHVGRVTGERRQVVLEVTDRPTPNEYVVMSGFGHRAQWFRNVVADPNVRVSIGRRRSVPARAEVIDPDRRAAVLERYARLHPRAWRALKQTLEEGLGAEIAALPMVSLHLLD